MISGGGDVRGWQRRRASRWFGRAVALVALVAVVAAVLVWRDRTSPLVLDPRGYAPQAGRRYITIGSTDDSQFTDDQLKQIAANYDVVLFAKFHAGWDVTKHHEATRRLKELNPNLKVFAYISTKYWFDANDWDGAVINPDWFLRNGKGEVIPVTASSHDPTSKKLGTYIDLSNPAYRSWVLGVAKSWMAAAPYDGIRFDAADPIGDFGDTDTKFWQPLLTPARLDAYNKGITTLLTAARTQLAPKLILFNGISPSPTRGPDRDQSMLGFTDGAMDESFCIDGDGKLRDVVPDIAIMQQHPDKLLQLRVTASPEKVGDNMDRYRRYCTAAFLMGWQPGATNFNMGYGYGVAQLEQQPPEIDLKLGDPKGQDVTAGALLHRTFANGVVYLNLGTAPATIQLTATMVRMQGGKDEGLVTGTTTVPPQDAVFLLDAAFVTSAT